MRDIEDRIADIFIIACVIAVIVLKCTGVITASWLVLTAIIWVPLTLGIILLGTVIMWELLKIYINRRRKK